MPKRTLFLNPPSFQGFDGGAGSRWPSTREIESYWYPVWLCYPAGMLENSKVLDAPPHGVSIEQFAANRIKQSITGHGHASKVQMQRAVQSQWNLAKPPEPPDVADALAVAFCCGMHLDRVKTFESARR